MVNYDILIAILITIGFLVTIYFTRKGNLKLNYMTELKLALLLAGLSFKDEKMKKLADLLMSIVIGLENTQLSSEEKKKEAMSKAIKEIHSKVNVELSDEVLSTIIDIAVSHMQNVK